MRFRVLAFALCSTLASVSLALAQIPVSRNFTMLAHLNEFSLGPTANSYSECWSYIHSDGREYAVIGTNAGTAIYNVTNPAATYRVGLILGPTSIWREMKSYRDWIYVVTEGTGTGQGLQIIRMTNPEAPVLAATYTGTFVRSHTVSVDTTRKLLICNGTRDAAGMAAGMRILSIANPEAPVEISWWPGGALPVTNENYIHDSVPIGTRLYGSSVYAGIQRVFDFTNPAAPTLVSSWTYPGGFTHNAWPDSSGNTLYVTDEVNGEPLKVFDISTLTSPVLVNRLTSNPNAIIHNAHVKGRELYLSNYTEGIRALDISDPVHPAEFASADSWPGASGGFFGVWGVCPYFPSGLVIASDMQTGLYVYQPNRDYGLLRVSAISQPGGGAVSGARVRLTPQGDSLETAMDGVLQFAPTPGSYTVSCKVFGYEPVSASAVVTAGVVTPVTLTLQTKPTTAVSGVVRDANTQVVLEGAEITLKDTPLSSQTNASGAYALGAVPEDVYLVEVRRPGYVPVTLTRRVGPGYEMGDFQLTPAAFYDAQEAANGWTVGATDDNATAGLWIRGEPIGTGSAQPGSGLGARRDGGPLASLKGPAQPMHEEPEEGAATPGEVQPEYDRTPGAGTLCWVTGQGTDPTQIGQADVDNGKTSLTTVVYDLSSYADPVIGYWRWFYTNTPTDSTDALDVYLSSNGGTTYTLVERVQGLHNAWTESRVRVRDFMIPTAQMRIRFVASDLTPGNVVEAAIDDLVFYEASAPNTGAPVSSQLALRSPWPNPSRGETRFEVSLPSEGRLEADVIDPQGRVVRSLARGVFGAGQHLLLWDGRDGEGRAAAPGLYFVRLRAAGEERQARFVRIR
ncbi:MAG: choice-of-anchor B family protein [Candidatus Eisenbacteria bacterium]